MIIINIIILPSLLFTLCSYIYVLLVFVRVCACKQEREKETEKVFIFKSETKKVNCGQKWKIETTKNGKYLSFIKFFY